MSAVSRNSSSFPVSEPTHQWGWIPVYQSIAMGGEDENGEHHSIQNEDRKDSVLLVLPFSERSNKPADNSGHSEPDRFPVRSITDDSKCESNVFPMCENGVLNLSRRANVRKLIISGNMFTNVVGFDMFKQCVQTAIFPQCLTFLDASSNTVEDLTEFLYLLPLMKLESIALANNPCLSSPNFDYRIYILSVLPSVQDIDGFLVSEEDQLKGEWLYSQGKGRMFKPDTGAHGSLVNYLERYCPFDIDGRRVSSLDQSILKVMEKRREILSNSSIEEDSSLSLSLHSPYGAWTARVIEGKENRLPNSSADEMPRHLFSAKMPQSSIPAEEKCAKSTTILQFEAPSRSSTLESIESSSTVTLVPALKNGWRDNRNVASTEATRTDRSRRSHLRERILQREQDSELKDEPGRDAVIRRIEFLEDRVKTISDENENLTRINDELSKFLVERTEKFTEEVSSLRTQLQSIVKSQNPDPCNLRVSRELGQGCYEIIWDMPVVEGYKVLTNGVESGFVRAPNNAARIADVEAGAELSIQVQVTVI
ncbi:unnamed protein product [Angiostrongylus costaricensis]|uniref:RING-type domain-containing protein n=1 Tax=Angiostrongylus costaricensis TaxID=334426 RepID=A0A158PDL0_ANGCS|nr:unnamed protein product [Angiostrongylus costaricensis]